MKKPHPLFVMLVNFDNECRWTWWRMRHPIEAAEHMAYTRLLMAGVYVIEA